MIDKYGEAHEKKKKTITCRAKTTPAKGTAEIKKYTQEKR